MTVDPAKLGRFGIGELANACDFLIAFILAECEARGAHLELRERAAIRSLALGLVEGLYEASVGDARDREASPGVSLPPDCYDTAVEVADEAMPDVTAMNDWLRQPGMGEVVSIALRTSIVTGVAAAMLRASARRAPGDMRQTLSAAAGSVFKLAHALRPFATIGELLSAPDTRGISDETPCFHVVEDGRPAAGGLTVKVAALRRAAHVMREKAG